MTAWENCNTGIKSRMLKHVLGYDQLSIGGCISVGALGSDGVFDSALVSADSFGIVYSYHLELDTIIDVIDIISTYLHHILMCIDNFMT